MPAFNRFDRSVVALLALYGCLTLLALALVPLGFLPAEDAIILFQYSRNLAEHVAITFLAHGPHVEGATDFAWMVMVAAGMRLGISPLWSSAGMDVLSAVALACVLLRLAKLCISPLRVFAIVGAAALMPQILAAASGFAVLEDAVLLTAVVLFVVDNRTALASITAFVFCLFRPDGVIFAMPLLVYLILRQPRRWRNIVLAGAFFACPGVLYFLWRWHYFGEMLPLPFLVKSDTPRTLGLFVPSSVHHSVIFLLFTGLLILPLVVRRRAHHLWLLFPLVVVPTFFYWAMRLDQNVAARFFYYLPLSAALMIAVNWAELRARRLIILRTGLAAWLMLLAMPLYRELRTFRDEQFGEVKRIAESLRRLPQPGTILTSEAGFLPYFSQWTTYDAWGLNTPRFAHRFFSSADVRALNPDLIVFHPDPQESCAPEASWPPSYPDRSWIHLTRNLVQGTASLHYELWLTSYGSEYYRLRKHWLHGEGDRECWLVRTDSSLYSAIAQILHEHHGVPSSP